MAEPTVLTMEATGGPLEAAGAAANADLAPRPVSEQPPSDGDLLQRYFTLRALYEATKNSSDDKIEEMKLEISNVKEKYDGYKTSLEVAEDKVKRLEKELNSTRSDLKDAHESLLIQKIDAENFRLQRDSALEVRNSLSNMVETSNTEIESMKSTIDKLHSQLDAAFKDRCEMMTKSKLLDSKTLMVDYKAVHLEQEKLGKDKLIQVLKNDLNRCSVDLHTTKTNFASMKVNYERQLLKKIDEINMARSNVSTLRAAKEELNNRINDLNKIISEQKEKEEKIHDDYQSELKTKTNLAELYKVAQEESNVKYEKLMKNFVELKKLSAESTERIEHLESELKTINDQHQVEIQQKNKSVKALERELQNANNFLRMAHGDLDSTMEGLSPSANIASNFIKSKLSLTKAYDEIVRLTEELDNEKNENKRLRTTLSSIVGELEERAPYYKQREKLYEEALENNNLNMERLQNAKSDTAKLKEEKIELDKMYKHLQRENVKLKEEMEDLCRQVCVLLKEIDTKKVRNLVNDDKYITLNGSQEMNASHVIEKNVVTFSDIQELQLNNQKLLRLVRDLSEKKEKNEQIMNDVDDKEQQTRIETLKNRVTELTAAQDRQVKMINKLVKELEAYKKMYAQKSNDTSMSVDKFENTLDGSVVNKTDFSKDINSKIQCLELIERELNDTKSELNREREKHRFYIEKSRNHELKLMESNESIYNQLNELQIKYDQCLSSSERVNLRIKFLEMELSTCNKETISLNEKIKVYASLLGKHESTIKHLSDELINSRGKLQKAQSLMNGLQSECKLLKQTANSSSDEMLVQNENRLALIQNIESIKQAMLGDSDTVEKLQSTMEEANRTCTTLRCMLQEEQEKYGNIASHLHLEINEHKAKLMEERTNVEKLTEELDRARNEIRLKAAMIEELNKNNHNTNYSSDINVTSYVLDAVRNNENKVTEYKDQISLLRSQLETSKNYIAEFSNIYEQSENELRTCSESFNTYKKENDIKMQELLKSEQSLKQKCITLEENLSLHTKHFEDSIAKINTLTLEVENKKLEIQGLTNNLSMLSEGTQITEDKYGHEIISHSKDLQMLTELKNELLQTKQILNNVSQSKTELESLLKENSMIWESKERMLLTENEGIKVQLQDLNEQNATLHDQINSLSKTFTSSQNVQHSESVDMDLSMEMNSSLIDDAKLSEQLVSMIKYLRKEKEVLLAKFEIIQTENARIKAQLEATECQLDEAKLNTSSEPAESKPASTKHSGIIRKVEELNAMSDCYSTLRKERDDLLDKIAELNESHKALQSIMEPLQGNNCELVVKVNMLESENEDYKKEVEKWKIRVNTLIDRDGQCYPEDWKKIQNEHENLNKLLNSEKENSKKMSEEVDKLKTENSLMEEQIEKFRKQNTFLTENFKKKMIELSVTRKEMEKIQTELTSTRNTLDKKLTEHTQVSGKLASNETLIVDIKNKEVQLRNIAKRYKTQYEELLVTNENEKQKSATMAAEFAATSENHTKALKELEQKNVDLIKNHTEKLAELNKQISAYVEENKKLQAEINTLKSSLQERDEKYQKTVKQVTAKIQLLTESRETFTKELQVQKELYEQNSDENDIRMQAIKSQYDGHLGKLEKEKAQLLQEKQNEINSLNRQIESLKLKLNQMQRKVDHQVPKPSTSLNPGDKLTTDPPTANIKPLAGVASPRDGNRRVAGETPLASIKPMASIIRTTVTLPPTAQVQGIVHQAPHTTGNVTGDMSSTPSSSHHATEFMPSSSSVGVRLHQAHSRHITVPPPESTQDMDVELSEDSEISAGTVVSQAVPQSAGPSQVGPQQVVALVMPRMESTSEMQTSHMHQQQASSSSGGNSSSTVTTSHGPSNSSATNTSKSEILRPFKRPHMGSTQLQQKTILKRAKNQSFQRVTDSEADYQVPTSSLRDQEDDVSFPDSEDDETFQDRIYDIEDENDADEGKDGSTRELRIVEEADIGENVSRSNEAEFSNSQDAQNVRGDDGIGRSSNVETHAAERPALLSNLLSSSQLQEQQIETISSGNGIDSGFLMLGAGGGGGVTSAVVSGAYEDGDDSIVPSTPTLYVPARNDGFGEAVRSPMSSRGMASNEARFTFNESGAGTTSGVIEDTHPDLAPQLTPHNRAPNDEPSIATSADDNTASLESSEAEVDGCISDGNAMDDEASAVSSQSSSFTLEEGREAEASTTATVTTPSRSGFTHRGMKPTRRGMHTTHVGTPRPTDHQRPMPIVWNSDANRRGFISPQRARGGRHIVRRPPTFFKRF